MDITKPRTALAVTSLLAATVVGASTQQAAAKPPVQGCTPTWTQVTPPEAPGWSPRFQSVNALSPTDALITGSSTFPKMPWTVHWNGSALGAAPTLPGMDLMTVDTVGEPSYSSSSDGWMVGMAGSRWGNVLERWHDGRWSMMPQPLAEDRATANSTGVDVTAISPSDAWLVGYFGQSVPDTPSIQGALTAHWDGDRWTIVPNPADHQPGALLMDTTVVSPTDIWTVGSQRDGRGVEVPLTLHWDGTSWKVVPAPRAEGDIPTVMYEIDAAGPAGVWAVGTTGTQDDIDNMVPFVVHWDGTKWTQAQGLSTGMGASDIFVAAPNDVWVLASSPEGQSFLHWGGTSWTTTPTPGDEAYGHVKSYLDIGGSGPDDMWLVGSYVDTYASVAVPQVWHRSCGKR